MGEREPAVWKAGGPPLMAPLAPGLELLSGSADPLEVLRTILHHSPFPFAAFRPDGHPFLFNPAFLQMFRAVPPPEYDLFADEVVEAIGLAPLLRRVLEGETVQAPPFWYDPHQLPHIECPPEARAVAIAATVFPIHDRAGQLAAIGIVYRDVTGEQEARQRLELLERERVLRAESTSAHAQLQALFAQAPAAVTWLRGPALVVAFASEALKRLFPGTAFEGRPIAELLPPGDAARVLPVLEASFRERRPYATSALPVRCHRAADGPGQVVGFFDLVLQPTFDAGGGVDGVLVHAVDVTGQVRSRAEQERLVEALRAGEARFRRVFESDLFGMLFTDLDGRVLDANDAFLTMLGHDRADLEAGRLRWDELTPPEWKATTARAIAELEATGVVKPFEKEYFRRDGSRIPVVIASTRVEEQGQNVTFVLDVSGRREAERREEAARREALAQQEQLHALFMEAPAAISVLRGPELVVSLSNAASRRLLAVPDPLGRPLRDLRPELAADPTVAAFQRVFETGAPFFGTEIRILQQDEATAGSRETFFNVVAQPTRDAAGAIDGVFTLAVEVTEQVRARERIEALAEHVRESEARYRSLVQASSEIVWTAAPDGRLVDPQAGWAAFTGQSFEAMRGTGWLDAVHPDDRAEMMERWTAAVRTTSSAQFEHRLRGRDGEYRAMQVRAVPVRDASGAVREWVGVHTDVSARRRAEANLRLLSDASRLLTGTLEPETDLQAVAELAVKSVATMCSIVLRNEAGQLERRALADRRPELAPLLEQARTLPVADGGPLLEVLRSGEARFIPDVDAATRDELAVTPEHRRLAELLDPRSIIAVPLLVQGRVIGVLSLASMAPDPRLTEGELGMAEELARRLGAAFDNARLYREAQQAVRLREEFLSIASHELNTPLTSIVLRLQSLARTIAPAGPGEPPSRQARDVEGLARQVKRLSALVNELLDVSRITSGRLRLAPEPVDLTALVRDVAARFEPEAGRAGSRLELAVADDVAGEWDRLRLEQIVSNLLSNACKYGEGRPIRIELRADGQGVALVVRDHGIGIDPVALERIFQRFERAVSERHFGGLGLGLYVTRQIVDAMGGTIVAGNAPGGGAVFTVTLPSHVPAAEVARTE